MPLVIQQRLLRGMTVWLWIAICCVGLAADPEETHYNVAVNLYNAGQWDAALKKISEREGQNLPEAMRAKYLYIRGLALEKGKKNAEARAAYLKLLDQYPKAPEAGRAQIALIYLDYADRNYDAVTSRYVQLNPSLLAATEKQQTTLMWAEALYHKKDLKQAMNAYQQALKLGADKNAVAIKLFELYYQAQMYQELLQLSASGIPGITSNLLSVIRAESLLALNKTAEAQTEAGKVPPETEYYSRASFTLAQAFIKSGKLKEAVAPLAIAIHGLKDPPAPWSAHLALAECLLENGKPVEAEQALKEAESRLRSLPEVERKKSLEQLTLLKIRLASECKDDRNLINVISESRSCIPPEKLPEILYMRLFALQKQKDSSSILRTMPEDYPVFQGKPQEGGAMLIYYAALEHAGKNNDGVKLLEEFLVRKPSSPESAGMRLALANQALKRNDYAKARDLFKALIAIPGARDQLGAEAYGEVLYNSGLTALKAGEKDEAIKALDTLIKSNPGGDLPGRALVLLGQVYAQKNDFKNATEAWKKALSLGKGMDESDVRDRLGRALFASGNVTGAREQFDILAQQMGGGHKLKRESRETWARALYAAGDFPAAAGVYSALYASFPESPAYAYECAVCFERNTNWSEAEKWYSTAEKNKEKLPSDYAQAVAQNASRARFQSGAGDRGLPFWIHQLAPSVPDADFDAAMAALNRITTDMKGDHGTKASLATAQKAYGPEQSRHYAVGAILLQCVAADGTPEELKQRGTSLVTEFNTHETTLTGKGWSATVAPAMIHFYKGEAERLSGNYSEALVSYETVLAAYPYNEWPDAAACGAAECYAALGDAKTALAKWTEVVKTGASLPASAKWVERAKQRINELSKGGDAFK